jgi:hypothetical protein
MGRIDSDVDKAIMEYNSEVQTEDSTLVPVFTEEQDGETLLGGEMRIRSPWNNTDD